MTASPDSLREQALRRIERKRKFQGHLLFYVVAMVVLAAVWAVTEYQNADGWPTGFRTGRESHDWDPWIVYPLIAGSVLLAVDAWHTFRRGPITEREIRREIERIGAVD